MQRNRESWFSDTGWQICFPQDEAGEDSAEPERVQAVDEFTEFFQTAEGREMLDSIPSNSFALQLDYLKLSHQKASDALRKIATQLMEKPDEVFNQISLAACRAGQILTDESITAAKIGDLLEDEERIQYTIAKPHEVVVPRVFNYSPFTQIRALKATSVGKFVAIRGTVVRVSPIRLQVTSMSFKCTKCDAEIFVRFPEFRYTTPPRCITVRCRARFFEPMYDTAEMVDYQKIRIQELQDRDGLNRDEGRMPRTIDVDLCDDLVDSAIPGDIVAVNGIVRVTRIDSKGGGKRARDSKVLFFMYLSATSITNPRNNSDNPDKETIELSNADMQEMIGKVLNKPDPFCFLVQSACPNIFGNEFVKSGMLLTLFGGTQKKRIGPKGGSETVSVRPDCHLLVVGDPGLGKSQMLKGMCRIAPRSVYVCGNTTTTAGLTVTVVRESSGEFALEAGALVLGDGGVCCIDEFDKMTAEHAALLEAMEQQSVSVAKAGLVCNLSARTSVIAAANPHGGQYDRSRTVSENLRLAQPLLSRFDLIFILLDRQDAERDRNISNHVMKTFGMRQSATLGSSAMHGALATQMQNPLTLPPDAAGSAKARKPLLERLKNTKRRDALPPHLFRQYIAYARTYVNPELSKEAKEVLKEFYLHLRREAKKQDTTPVTTRQLESLIRLAEARARAEMRTIVTGNDAEDVVDIMSQSMLETLMNEHGEVVLSRNTGMSRTKDAHNFRRKLFAESKRARSALFNKSKMKNLAETVGITGDRLERAIETLNVQGELLKKGNGMWELKSSSFSQAF